MSAPTVCRFCDREPILLLTTDEGREMMLCRLHAQDALGAPRLSEHARLQLLEALNRAHKAEKPPTPFGAGG